MPSAVPDMTTLLSKAIDFYNPMTNWQRFFNPQFIFNANPQDEGVEKAVLGKVGSYGSQLSTLIDAIEALRAQAEKTGAWGPDATEAFAEFEELRANAAAAVADYRHASPDDIVSAVASLAKRSPGQMDGLWAKLEALRPKAATPAALPAPA